MLKPVKLKIADLRPDPENMRLHGNENVEMIRRSILENGQYRPLVVDSNTMVVKIGNGRLEAMRLLGMEKCWCLLMDFRGHEGLEVLDNRLNELSKLVDPGVDVWLRDEKGFGWWGVDSEKSAQLAMELERSEGGRSGRHERMASAPLCPCCGKPLRKVMVDE